MRYLTKLVGTGLILATVTACGGQETMATHPASGGDSVAPSGSVTTSPSAMPPAPPNPTGKPRLEVPAGSTPVPAGKVDATALPSGFPHEVYTANGGTILNVRAEEGGCGHALGEAIEQTAQRVVVDLSETKAQTGQMCTMDLRYPYLSVALAAPLGERTVVLKQSPPR
ncbi:hypothetical protein VSH64_02140 [Amycolatopsis rhabdoformis]|uniref:Lipoprotein n=1 Tax=Amycolatopsis rhabdoformis TaxID=1448059 RepID=A0ABZ1IAG2_9PSEU|nr:hypothetical protein [Amycolatopsis rhabdoformis]WSE30933.1 hypothetical protein VSH64_02140 [Amycolatopsis rhabdoformis]